MHYCSKLLYLQDDFSLDLGMLAVLSCVFRLMAFVVLVLKARRKD